ncbi:hypothetical protein LTR36_003412 [Oleoguttula mirabilis]|uniref:Sin3-associated polypeptide Sap18 n=1 Tax=Oleoguttula mirabilis TaxID=1507867 RepID=A0AAV9JL51_9PEZI|nr:hypothetical protein LTR36_003412 [Oleoguttula mirabilis]
MSSLQPTTRNVDRTTTAPFLLRLFWRPARALDPAEFSVAPPSDTTAIPDYASLLPPNIRQQSVQIYTWPTCTLAELTGLLTSVLPPNVLPSPAVGTRLVYKLIFPDTRAEVREGGKGRWVDKPLGSVVIGGRDADADVSNGDGEAGDTTNGDDAAAVKGGNLLEGDADKTLFDARFVIGDYVACTIYPPGPDGRIAAAPPPRPPRDAYGGGGRGENGGGGGYGRGAGGGGGYRGGYGARGGGAAGAGGNNGAFGATAPPIGDWRRGERPPAGGDRGGYGGGGGGGYGRGRAGRPY